jgi:hypothetical protein
MEEKAEPCVLPASLGSICSQVVESILWKSTDKEGHAHCGQFGDFRKSSLISNYVSLSDLISLHSISSTSQRQMH